MVNTYDPMKKLFFALRVIALSLLLVAMIATPVMGDTSVNVTVTAVPWISSGITNFTITYISETQLDLSWVFIGDGVNIMIRGSYDGYPDDIPNEDTTPSDGHQVYYGSGTSFSDTSMNFEENAGILYYKAWAQKATGKWYTVPESGEQEGISVTLLAFIIAAIALTIATFAIKRGRSLVSIVAAGVWMILGVYNYTRYETLWDIYYALFWLSMGLVIAHTLIPAILKEKAEIEPTIDDLGEDKELIGDIEAMEKDRKRMDRIFMLRKSKPRPIRFPKIH